MTKREACALAYDLIANIRDIKDEEFVNDLIFAIWQRDEMTLEEMLECAEIEEANE